MSGCRVPIQMLGQSGMKFSFPGATVYIDPYLSDSVKELDSPDLDRLLDIPIKPEQVTDADWVLITHEHIDHCDPHTIPKLAQASSQAQFIGPRPVLDLLEEWGIAKDRLHLATEQWRTLTDDIRLIATPAAHPEIERNAEGELRFLGFVLEFKGRKIYLSGDTSAREEILDVLKALGPIHTAFLPVNEHNYFRARRGIIGNMSVREALQFAEEIGVRQLVAVHWDMFASNATDPEEIRLIYQQMKPSFGLLLRPTLLNLSDIRVSVIIRTLNEAKHLDELLTGIANQVTEGLPHEVVLVDSGSTDGTLDIAERHGCVIRHITKEEFSFGHSLNMGCEVAVGDLLVITSGHCVPVDEYWLQKICQPIVEGKAQYTYGRQLGGPESQFSECRIFAKYFPEDPTQAQKGFFCNNANSAISQQAWEKYRFDEELTGLEDMELAKRLVQDGGVVQYVHDAGVYHYHYETWKQIRRRFEREAIALQKILPQVHVNALDMMRYAASSIWKDCLVAARQGALIANMGRIMRYRWNQYRGAYIGNHDHRKLSGVEKEKYFFPA